MTTSIPVQSPAEPRRLILLFHGVGAAPADMVPLAQAIAASSPDAAVVCVRSRDASDFGRGYQWFSVANVTEGNRPARVVAAMPGFVAIVQHFQSQFGLTPVQTCLIGFSQGTIMALEALAQPVPLASQVIGLSGRFAARPETVIADVPVTLIHGDQDGVIPVERAIEAEAWLRDAGAEVSLTVMPGLAHGIDSRVAERVIAVLADWQPGVER